MDANGLRFWNLAERAHWALAQAEGIQFDDQRRVLRLASRRPLPPAADSAAAFAEATSRLERVPAARDDFGSFAYWDSASQAIVATGALPGFLPIYTPPAGEQPSDLAIGFDGVLYIAIAGAVTLYDLRQRFATRSVTAADFTPWRLAADPSGGVWVLDRTAKKLALLSGLPLPDRPFADYAPTTFRPCPEDPTPPRLVVHAISWPDGESPRALAVSPRGRLALLSWAPDAEARLRLLTAEGELGAPRTLGGARFPYSLKWLDEAHVALLLAQPGLREAPVFPVDDAAAPTGDIYPLRDHEGGPFLHTLGLPLHYPQRAIPSESTPFHPQPLYRLSLPSFASQGEAANGVLIADHVAAGLIVDSEDPRTEWHRLCVEASIPPHCAVSIDLAATDNAAPPAEPEAWHEHRFGGNSVPTGVPRAAWAPEASELPFHAGLLPCPRERDRSGLFTVLIQRAGLRVRTLRGRYLWLRIRLSGDGRATPEIAAVRAYASRFSYLNHYLPELYRETEFGLEADNQAPATPSDFLERLLDNFEGVLTPLEDRIASSYLLTVPRSAPDDALPWLGSWIGMSFDAGVPPARRRHMLAAAPQLYRKHGTLRGLELALDIATDGAVTRGAIVVLEDFRLRRTLATILGADLADERDPLLPGLSVSGNSYVGDTLMLGEEHRREFLSLFAADLEVSEEEADEIQRFFDRVAYRATILVHEDLDDAAMAIVRRVAELQTPAHVATRVLKATYPFIVGIASLVRVDTFLGKKPAPMPVKVGRSKVGERDYLIHAASLDPRLEGGRSHGGPAPVEKPVADIGPDRTVPFGASFELDGSGSSAAPGRVIASFIWERNE